MTDDKYLQAIQEAQDLLTELLNDPEHGKLTFKGLRGRDDLIITGPQQLGDLISGTVLAIAHSEWMAITPYMGERRHWQNFAGSLVATSEELYIHALKESGNLQYCHKAF